MTTDLRRLGRRLAGRWTTEATHPALPGTVVSRSGEFEWLAGERFLVFRSHSDHPDFPDSISVIGDTGGLRMHYFDSRGVHRIYAVTVTGDGWGLAMDRHAPAGSFAPADAPFAQRVTLTVEDGGRTMSGTWQLCADGASWEDDLVIGYRRAASPGPSG